MCPLQMKSRCQKPYEGMRTKGTMMGQLPRQSSVQIRAQCADCCKQCWIEWSDTFKESTFNWQAQQSSPERRERKHM